MVEKTMQSPRKMFMEGMLSSSFEDDTIKFEEDQGQSDDVRREDSEDAQPPTKRKYPKAVAFIIGNEFCERFSFYGMRTVLTLYLTEKLGYNEDTATGVFHAFVAACYFMPLVGAIVADSWLGKFRTIWMVSLVYILGLAFKTLATITPLGLPPTEFAFVGLALIAVGTGGIKPCVSAFGGDQFQLPEQERQLQTFFSFFYFSINAGSLISSLVTPVLRQDVHCFGEDSCYPLAFGVPAALMAIATIILVIGKPLYVIKPPQGNIIPSVMGAIYMGIRGKISSCLMYRTAKRDHWLDYAKDEYDDGLVNDTKKLLKVLKIFLPIPVFWALFDQQSSRWTFQAVRTSGQVGTHLIKPDQMQVVNPLLILVLIPVFDRVIYPQFAKIGLLKDPIQRIFIGGLLTGLAFFMSGMLELTLQPTYGIVPKPHESHMHVMNSMDCLIGVQVSHQNDTEIYHMIESKASYIIQGIVPGKNYSVTLTSLDVEPTKCMSLESKQYSFKGAGGSTAEYIVAAADSSTIDAIRVIPEARPSDKKNSHSNPTIRVVVLHKDALQNTTVRLYGVDTRDTTQFRNMTMGAGNNSVVTEYATVFPQAYNVRVNGKVAHRGQRVALKQGGVYTVVATTDNGITTMDKFVLTPENSVHMLWLLPQYFVITCGEVMLSITGLEFSYSQAPAAMKSMVQACWLLTTAIGNLVVAFVAESHLFETQAPEFFLFGALMVVVMFWLWWLAKGSKCSSDQLAQTTTE